MAETDAPDGSKNTSVDLLYKGARLAAVCMSGPSNTAPESLIAPSPAAVREQIETLATTLGIEDAQIQSLPPDIGCDEVRGLLAETQGTYQIAARLCIGARSTFIVEAIFENENQAPDGFLQTLRPK
jgi:hypothetical protein